MSVSGELTELKRLLVLGGQQPTAQPLPVLQTQGTPEIFQTLTITLGIFHEKRC